MIYLIDRKFTIEGALDILVNQVKCPKIYKKFFCFCCKVKGKVEVEVNGSGDVNVNDNQGTCFADGNDNQGTCFADGNDNDNQGTCFADDKQDSSLSEEDDIVWPKALNSTTKQRDKSCS